MYDVEPRLLTVKDVEDMKKRTEVESDYCVGCGKFEPVYKYGGNGQPYCKRCAESPTGEPQIPLVIGYKYHRNEPCFCGSGKKFKKCCEDKVNSTNSED